ncbi:hypothetical protein EHS25_004126 [Saitozyma podzolica]|uniref:Uncharacterized protein n=1 Tax=Saitozyma podzolica TaxID=1890683 RepID=A0A427YT54_9TREE|nr:hypothetical protein EHS25_004126 [Saitozyma podzolica]
MASTTAASSPATGTDASLPDFIPTVIVHVKSGLGARVTESAPSFGYGVSTLGQGGRLKVTLTDGESTTSQLEGSGVLSFTGEMMARYDLGLSLAQQLMMSTRALYSERVQLHIYAPSATKKELVNQSFNLARRADWSTYRSCRLAVISKDDLKFIESGGPGSENENQPVCTSVHSVRGEITMHVAHTSGLIRANIGERQRGVPPQQRILYSITVRKVPDTLLGFLIRRHSRGDSPLGGGRLERSSPSPSSSPVRSSGSSVQAWAARAESEEAQIANHPELRQGEGSLRRCESDSIVI